MTETCSAATLFEALRRPGMTHLIGVPDNGSATLFELAAARPDVELLTVTREGEAFAVASGLWLGGKEPVVVVQNTGLLESGDSLRGTAYRMGVPLLILVGVRGHAKMVRNEGEIDADRRAGRVHRSMKRADIDSVALLTEPTLDAWNVPHVAYRGDRDIEQIADLWLQARQGGHPVAVLLPSLLT